MQGCERTGFKKEMIDFLEFVSMILIVFAIWYAVTHFQHPVGYYNEGG
jgi:hypothetical protein